MFSCMFRRKRIQLIKRLLELRVRKEHEIRRKGEAAAATTAAPDDDPTAMETCGGGAGGSAVSGGACYQLTDEGLLRNLVLKRLKDNQLEMLLEAVESGGGGVSTCVLIPKDAIPEPHALGCRFWRWPDVRSCAELRRMPACSSATDPIYMCCNPYHWSRLCQPDSPPPPYSRFNNERLKPEDRAPSEHNTNIMPYVAYRGSHLLHDEPFYESDKFRGSLSTSGGEGELKENEWCRLAYWELSHRVGPAYPVQNTSINIFWTDMQADGLSLETLAHQSASTPDTVHKNRNKIGLGITLSLEQDGVWVYNRSEWPVFVNSPSLDRPGCRTFLVYRVPAGHCFRIFRPDLDEPHPSPSFWQDDSYAAGPVDPNSVRISFAKGWGPKYHRQEITGCPTWLEVLLSPCR